MCRFVTLVPYVSKNLSDRHVTGVGYVNREDSIESLGLGMSNQLGWEKKLIHLLMFSVSCPSYINPFVHKHRSDRRMVAVVGKVRGKIFSQYRFALSK